MLKVMVGYPNRDGGAADSRPHGAPRAAHRAAPVVDPKHILDARSVRQQHLHRRQGEGLHRGHRLRHA